MGRDAKDRVDTGFAAGPEPTTPRGIAAFVKQLAWCESTTISVADPEQALPDQV